jgi:hypothetical protein
VNRDEWWGMGLHILKFEDVADRLSGSRDVLRRSLGKHIKKVAKAMHSIEWVDSGDFVDGDEVEDIKAVLNGTSTLLDTLLEDGREVIRQLKELGVKELTYANTDTDN